MTFETNPISITSSIYALYIKVGIIKVFLIENFSVEIKLKMGIFVTFSGKTPAKSSCNRIVVASSNYPWVRGEGDKSRKKL